MLPIWPFLFSPSGLTLKCAPWPPCSWLWSWIIIMSPFLLSKSGLLPSALVPHPIVFFLYIMLLLKLETALWELNIIYKTKAEYPYGNFQPLFIIEDQIYRVLLFTVPPKKLQIMKLVLIKYIYNSLHSSITKFQNVLSSKTFSSILFIYTINFSITSSVIPSSKKSPSGLSL